MVESHLINSSSQALTIEVSKLSKRFSREWIFKDFSFTFTSDNTYVILGPNGSGKSTLLQILWGQMIPSEGTVRYSKAGHPVSDEDIFKHISLAAPYMDLVEQFTIKEQIDFHFKLKSPIPDMNAELLLQELKFTENSNRFISELSSGMRQRLKLGLCMFTDADVYFLDEPSTNLDKETVGWYNTQTSRLKSKGKLIIIASNNEGEYPPEATPIRMTEIKPKQR